MASYGQNPYSYSIYSDEAGKIKFAKMFDGGIVDEVEIPADCLNDDWGKNKPVDIGGTTFYLEKIYLDLSEYEKDAEDCCFYVGEWSFNEAKRIVSKGKTRKKV